MKAISRLKLFDFLLMLGALVLLIILWNPLFKVLRPFIYGFVLAYLLDPLVKKLEKKGLKKGWAVLIVFIVILGIITFLVSTLLPMLSVDVDFFVKDVPQIVRSISEFLDALQAGKIKILPESVMKMFNIQEHIQTVTKYLGQIFGNAISAIISSTAGLIDMLLAPMVTIYLLLDKKRIFDYMRDLVPERWLPHLQQFFRDCDLILGSFIKGQLLVAAIVGGLTGLGALIIGIPYPLLVGFFAGITNVIPYFGPWIGGILPVILALTKRPILALWAALWIFVVQQIDSNLISPQIMSKSVGLHPLVVIFSVLFFGQLMGIPGMILGVPFMGMLLIVAQNIQRIREKLDHMSDFNLEKEEA